MSRNISKTRARGNRDSREITITGGYSTFFRVAVQIVRKFVQEMNRGPYPTVEILEVQELIRSVGIFIGQTEAKQHRIESEKLFELNHNRNTPAFALIQRLLTESLFQCRDRGLHARTVNRRNGRLTTVHIADSDGNGLRRDLTDVFFKKLRNLLRLLVRNKPHGNLR